MLRPLWTIPALLYLLPGCGPTSPSRGPAYDETDIAQHNRGVGLMGHFKYKEAQDQFAALVQKHPAWTAAKVNMAIATLNLQTEGSEQRALDILAEVLAKEPENLRAIYCTGLLQLYLGDSAHAQANFARVAEADPKDAYAAYYLAQCFARNGESEKALQWYERASSRDPYLRSAYYGMFQTYQRSGQREKAREMLDIFQKLEDNPQARQVEFKYTRMGPKASVATVDLRATDPPAPVAGPLFRDGEPLLQLADGFEWNSENGVSRGSVTLCDMDGDGHLDIFAPGALDPETAPPNAVLLSNGNPESPILARDHPLAAIPDVRTALWGDMDNDGATDVYLCRKGANQLWRHTPEGQWQDVTKSTGTGGGDRDTVDGMWLDADHDGDLDLFLVNADGPNELLSNNNDGSFRPLGEERGISGGNRESRTLAATDLDNDRDVDLIVIHAEPPHEVFLNDRLWDYRPAPGFEAFTAAQIHGLVAADLDADGRVELYTSGPSSRLSRWLADETGTWHGEVIAESVPEGSSLAAIDPDGSGRLALAYGPGPSFWPELDRAGGTELGTANPTNWVPAYFEPQQGPALLGYGTGGELVVRRPGPSRYPYVGLSFSGKEDKGESMRSNASGIGTRFAVRVGSSWVAGDTFRTHSAGGQSMQPAALGLGGEERLDFVAITWSDGVFQTELGLEAGKHHHIVETQRQLSSCPVLFAWDGEGFVFVSDLLGVGGMGYATGPGQYGTPRPWEHFLLPRDLAKPRDGNLVFKIAEPMEEACYLDSARLTVYDLPPGWSMTLDERMGLAEPLPTGEPVFYRSEQLPRRAVNERGQDVTETVLARDLQAAPLPELDRRFIGRLASEHLLTLHFNEPLDRGHGRPVLVIDGWVEYPYSQTNFAAWQAGASYEPPTLEARSENGDWKPVLVRFGYPAGMPRQMSVPLANLPEGTTRLRLRTNQEIYWDRIAVVRAEPCPQARRTSIDPNRAVLAADGFAKRTTGPQRTPHFDAGQTAPLWDTRHQTGFYTAFGEITPLIRATDDALAIFGPGEAVELTYPAPPPPAEPGWTRYLVLETAGWCKDMDLYTKDGETLAPLPQSGKPTETREALHRRYNTRFQSGF